MQFVMHELIHFYICSMCLWFNMSFVFTFFETVRCPLQLNRYHCHFLLHYVIHWCILHWYVLHTKPLHCCLPVTQPSTWGTDKYDSSLCRCWVVMLYGVNSVQVVAIFAQPLIWKWRLPPFGPVVGILMMIVSVSDGTTLVLINISITVTSVDCGFRHQQFCKSTGY